ncbi:branched-chain amino acid ABC transporter substrate-binding protein [Dethiosulfovibrio salsuginis]|uniref:Amino acid/amide ABC transporter substrate-binding protein, HAAT family n=1 Tax=Dethiosulfovibrio salsuginis TaxID=561720 RepID=A0A1X7KEQ6_9BACT|nr:branched-chain amino acid ABC transporter substrate-binding protein [Dethiosulfovibrio salsuginis]SMG39594.1 amino acid/amide ABC transporter substrate-binding protein, HAAT family [Dethiosulfovibrio salsuginis]
MRIICLVVVFFALFSVPSASAEVPPKIAFIGPLSGHDGHEGLAAKQAFLLAIKQVSDETGKEIVPVVMDDFADPDQAREAALTVASDSSVMAVVAHYHSVCAFATMDVFSSAKLPVIMWAAAHPGISEKGDPYIFQMVPILDDMVLSLGRLMFDRGLRSIALIGERSAYGRRFLSVMAPYLREIGVDVPLVIETSPMLPSYDHLADRVADVAPDGVAYGGFTHEGAMIKMALDRKGLSLTYGVDSSVGEELFCRYAGPAAEGTLGVLPLSPIYLPGGTDFLKGLYGLFPDAVPANYTALAYDAATVVAWSTYRGQSRGREGVREEISRYSGRGLTGLIGFDYLGRAVARPIGAFVVKGGRWLPLRGDRDG